MLLDGLPKVGLRLRASEAMEFFSRIDPASGLGAARSHDVKAKRKAWQRFELGGAGCSGSMQLWSFRDWISGVQVPLVWTALRLTLHALTDFVSARVDGAIVIEI